MTSILAKTRSVGGSVTRVDYPGLRSVNCSQP
jgi:hypothetical protein